MRQNESENSSCFVVMGNVGRFYILFLLALASCGVKHEARIGATREGREMYGVVRDYRDIDGCGWLIEVPDSGFWHILKWPEGKPPSLLEGQIIRAVYADLSNRPNTCFAVTRIVRIKNYELGIKGKVNCVLVHDPHRVPWMRKLLFEYRVQSVTMYELEEGWWYFLKSHDGLGYMYDCQGNLICSDQDILESTCEEKYKDLPAGKILWVENFIQEK